MSWLILSLISLFSFVIYDIAGRYLATRSENPRAFAVLVNGAIMLMGPTIFLVDRTLPQPLNFKIIVLALIGLILWGLMGRFEYFAKKHVEASVLSITGKIAPVITFILGIVVLGESLTVSKMWGIGLIIVANILLYVGQKKGSVISATGLKYALILIAVLGVAWMMDAINVKYWGVGTFTTLSYIAPCVMSAFFPTLKKSDYQKELSLTPWWQIVVLAFFSFLGYTSLLKALSLGEASNVVPITTSTTPFIVLFGYIFLGERTHLARKIIASLMAVFAIYLMR